LEVGAVSLGALVSTALLSSALDITGMIAAGTLAIVGLFVIPHKRKQAKENFREKIVTLRKNLHDALTSAFKIESENAIIRLRENIAPYTRYVHAEQERVRERKNQLDEIRQIISTLHTRVDTIVK
jgi:ABC-type transport system involved in cytochrome bd biosynthesis fused ATPase/permease subunit